MVRFIDPYQRDADAGDANFVVRDLSSNAMQLALSNHERPRSTIDGMRLSN